MKLTRTDKEAIKEGDSNYILNKGANYYIHKDYENAVKYYHLASTMGNDIATSNLGYCYLYGRSVEADTELAITYFELASQKNNVDACYKLGDIYSSDKWGVKDSELSIYYYNKAACILLSDSWDDLICCEELDEYPSLCFALGRELMPDGLMRTDVEAAYLFLKHAEKGYEKEIRNGDDFYVKALSLVKERINSQIFDDIRDEYESFYDEDEMDYMIS